MQHTVEDWTQDGKELMEIPAESRHPPARNSYLDRSVHRAYFFVRHLRSIIHYSVRKEKITVPGYILFSEALLVWCKEFLGVQDCYS